MRKLAKSYCLLLAILMAGCNEVTPSSYNCKNFNRGYVEKLSKNNNLESTRELARLYVECNDNQTEEYKDLALFWSEKLIAFENANEEDWELYKLLRNLDEEKSN